MLAATGVLGQLLGRTPRPGVRSAPVGRSGPSRADGRVLGAASRQDQRSKQLERDRNGRSILGRSKESLSPNDPDVEEILMASEQPQCPDCSGPIGADWDWCHHCGYDPDHLKPWDWQPGMTSASGGSVQTAT